MDRRNEKTSRLIMNTFMDLLKEKGFEKITVSDISERADINRGTVYFHYKDKYDILEQCIGSYVNELITHCSEDAPLKLQNDALLNIFRYLENNITLYRLLYRNDKSGVFKAKLSTVIYDQTRQVIGRFPEEYTLSKEVTTEFLVNGFLGVIEWWLANDLPCSPEDITKQLMSFLDPYLKNLK